MVTESGPPTLNFPPKKYLVGGEDLLESQEYLRGGAICRRMLIGGTALGQDPAPRTTNGILVNAHGNVEKDRFIHFLVGRLTKGAA